MNRNDARGDRKNPEKEFAGPKKFMREFSVALSLHFGQSRSHHLSSGAVGAITKHFFRFSVFLRVLFKFIDRVRFYH